MPKKQKTGNSNAVWGAKAIGELVDLTEEEVRYRYRQGVFGDAVTKAGHRTLLGDRRRLKQFPQRSTTTNND